MNTFPICPNESSPFDWLVSWRCFEQKVIGLGEDGQPKKRVEKLSKTHSLLYSLTTSNQTCTGLFNTILLLGGKMCNVGDMDKLPLNTILFHIDFAKNIYLWNSKLAFL